MYVEIVNIHVLLPLPHALLEFLIQMTVVVTVVVTTDSDSDESGSDSDTSQIGIVETVDGNDSDQLDYPD